MSDNTFPSNADVRAAFDGARVLITGAPALSAQTSHIAWSISAPMSQSSIR
ncbi:MAG: hypothetical protein HC822_21025 [Oscillochloris sp.]|nr:hypothetical protein [Oscillochloris sp.]